MKEKKDIPLISNLEYKQLFLPNISEEILNNQAIVQLYRLEFYLRNILIPVKPYRTTFNFIIFVTKGTIKQHLDGEDFLVKKGEILYIRQGSITATLEIDPEVKGYFLVYENEVYSNPSFSINPSKLFFIAPYIKNSEIDFLKIIKILNLMEFELIQEDQNITISFLKIILLKILNQTSEAPKETTRTMDIAFQFRNLLYDFHTDEKKVFFYANKIGVTENYLNKCLKKITGKSPKQWINEIDIDHSKYLLQTDKTIAEIAYELNFQTPSHFSQVFKKVVGKSPKDYRSEKLK
ncbi:helix-turn-helix domain-containing protein [Riemerella columbina]|uniref:helix-turn-helix domain-containing protein n=1 Tax=Riemerella columbina TaxID=103810 RepID=UPI00036B0A97|nr:AraC family transcriptional regulator [Riemerella columbina]